MAKKEEAQAFKVRRSLAIGQSSPGSQGTTQGVSRLGPHGLITPKEHSGAAMV
ncbi:hypothetical protein GJ744_004891 [Endocarpon pusillum]|uniref:Uncharacterized protein n=1 Tax=Endocarpon pusillum TaxID=364733 RepID=A0A8H7AQR6_9EURO|nr:hypothetical protein GJ744_004891 [Endocarpon pusillum]